MALFDSYFDPQQFQDSGGLLGRLLSLQQAQGQYQPGEGFDPQSSAQAPSMPQTPASPSLQSPAPQFGGAVVSQAAPQAPDFGDRLNAGFQNWAHTPVGDPFGAIANGIAGFGAGQRTDAAGSASSQTPTPASLPGLGDRLSAGFQSWVHTPAGNPLAALANGIAGLGSGQRTDPAGTAQPQIDAPGNPQRGLNSQYQALRPILGDHNAMLAIIHPEAGKALIARALRGG